MWRYMANRLKPGSLCAEGEMPTAGKRQHPPDVVVGPNSEEVVASEEPPVDASPQENMRCIGGNRERVLPFV